MEEGGDENNASCSEYHRIRLLQMQESYRLFKLILDDESKKYEAKVGALLTTWEKIASLVHNCEDAVDNLFTENLHRDTLHLVLQGDWPKLSPIILTHLTVTLQRCINSVNGSLCVKVATLKEIVQEPWGHPTLKKILASDLANIKPVEAQEFCSSEGILLLLVRLNVLCASKCEDIALKLSRLCFPYWRHNPRCPTEYWTQLRDTHVALLYKFKLISNIVDEVLQGMSFEEGAQMVLHHSSLATSRLWKHPGKIAMLESCYFLSAALQQPSNLEQVLHVWLELHRSSQTSQDALLESLRGLTTEVNSEQIHTLCGCLTKELGSDLQAFYIELYIRGLNFDLNSLGHHKLESDKQKVREIECRLSRSFLHLAELLSENVVVSRECVLTAFSLHPCEETFARVQAFAPSVEENSAVGNITGEKVTNASNYDEFSIPEQLADAAVLGLSQQLCDDLTVVISSPRWHSLSWLLKWQDLESLCRRYLQDPEGSRYVIKELNFLDIDYEKFKDLPSKQYYGIEEGYEHCLYSPRKRGRKKKPAAQKAKAKPKAAKVATKKTKEVSLPVISKPQALNSVDGGKSEFKSGLELNLATQLVPISQPIAATQPKPLPHPYLEIENPMATISAPQQVAAPQTKPDPRREMEHPIATISVPQPVATPCKQLKRSVSRLETENPEPTPIIPICQPVVQCKRLKVSDSHNKIVLVEPQLPEVKIIKHVRKCSRPKCPSILQKSKSNNVTLQETDCVRSLRWLPVRASIAAAFNSLTSQEAGVLTDSDDLWRNLSSVVPVNLTSQKAGLPTDSAKSLSYLPFTASVDNSPPKETGTPNISPRSLRNLPVRASIAASIAQETVIPTDSAKSLSYLPFTASVDNSSPNETGTPNISPRSLRNLPVRASIAASLLQQQNSQQQTLVFKKFEPKPVSNCHKLNLDSISPTISALASVYQTQETPEPNSVNVFKLSSIRPSCPQQQVSEMQQTCKQEPISSTISALASVYQTQETLEPNSATVFKLSSIRPSCSQQQVSEMQQTFKQEPISSTITVVPSLYPTQQANRIIQLDSIPPSSKQASQTFKQEPISSTITVVPSLYPTQQANRIIQLDSIPPSSKQASQTIKQEPILPTITVVPALTKEQESFSVNLKQNLLFRLKSIIPPSTSASSSTDTNPVPNHCSMMQPVTVQLCEASERTYQNGTITSPLYKIINPSGNDTIVPLTDRNIVTPQLQLTGSARTEIFSPPFTQVNNMAAKRKALPELLPMPKPPKLSAMTVPPKLPIMTPTPVKVSHVVQQTVKAAHAKPPRLMSMTRSNPPKLKSMVDLKRRTASKIAVHPKLAKSTTNTEKLTYGFCSDIRLSTSPIKSESSKPVEQSRPKPPQHQLSTSSTPNNSEELTNGFCLDIRHSYALMKSGSSKPATQSRPQNKFSTSSHPNSLLKQSAIQFKHSSAETENSLNVAQSNNSKLLPSVQPVSRVYGFLSNALKKPNILNEAQNLLNQTFVGKTCVPVEQAKVQQQTSESKSATLQCHYLRPNFPFKQFLNFKCQNDSQSALINQDKQTSHSTGDSEFSDIKIEVVERKQNLVRCTISEEMDLKFNTNRLPDSSEEQTEVQNHDSAPIKTTDGGRTLNKCSSVHVDLFRAPVKEECISDDEQLNNFDFTKNQVKRETIETEVTEITDSEDIDELLAELFPDSEPTEWSSVQQ